MTDLDPQQRKALDRERNARVEEYGVRYTADRRALAEIDFEAGWNSREAALAVREEPQLDGDGNPIDWRVEYEKLLSDETERAVRLHERLAGMLGVSAHPVGPANLTGELLDEIERKLAAREEHAEAMRIGYERRINNLVAAREEPRGKLDDHEWVLLSGRPAYASPSVAPGGSELGKGMIVTVVPKSRVIELERRNRRLRDALKRYEDDDLAAALEDTERPEGHAIHKQRGVAEHLFRCECGLRNMMRGEAVTHVDQVAKAGGVRDTEQEQDA